MSGITIRLAGGTILYKTKFQDCVAMSSTEAEFTAACDAGKEILYVRSILDEIDMEQEQATTLYIDNNGALMMGNAQQPTRRTKHMDIKKLALQDWVQRDMIIMKRIHTSDNYADTLTKPLGKQLHYRHNDFLLGKHIPTYASAMMKTGSLHDASETPQPFRQDSLCSTEHGGGKIPKGGDSLTGPT